MSSVFAQLERSDQTIICQPYKVSHKNFFQEAFDYLAGNKKREELSLGAAQLADALEAAAARLDFQRNYEPWKKIFADLTFVMGYGESLLWGAQGGTLAMGGLTLLALRNSKLLAVANGCATVAVFILTQTFSCFLEGMKSHAANIENLTIENRSEFEERVTQHYKEIEKTHFLLSTYYQARKEVIGEKEHRELLLLKEDIEAMKELPLYSATLLVSCFSSPKSPSPSLQDEVFDIQLIKAFFLKFEKMALQGKQIFFIGTLSGMAYMYCAWVQKAYLMIIAGLIYTLTNGLLFYGTRSYQIGAVALQTGSQEDLLKIYHQNVSGILFPSMKDLDSLHACVTIPLEKILKLIPISSA